MDFEAKQQGNVSEIQSSNDPEVYELCKDVSYSCNHYAKELDTMKMSKEIFDVYTLNVNILSATNELWRDLLSVITRQKKFDAENLCFSIMTLPNCIGLNMFYQSFNAESIHYMHDYIGPQGHDDHFGLVKKLFTSFDRFLELSLPSFEVSIKSLLIVIDTPYDTNSFSHDYYKKPNIGYIVNVMILKYLQKLRDLFSEFRNLDPLSELIKMKKQIESRINKAIEANKEILKDNKPADPIKSSTTSTTESVIISTSTTETINSTISHTIPSSTSVLLPTGSTTSKATNTVFNNSTENYFNQSNVTYKDNNAESNFEVTENPNFFIETTNLSNIEPNLGEVIKLSSDNSNNLLADQSSVANSKTAKNWIILGSVFSVIGLLALIAFGVKKYILKRNKSIYNRSIRLNNEKYNSVAFNKY